MNPNYMRGGSIIKASLIIDINYDLDLNLMSMLQYSKNFIDVIRTAVYYDLNKYWSYNSLTYFIFIRSEFFYYHSLMFTTPIVGKKDNCSCPNYIRRIYNLNYF